MPTINYPPSGGDDTVGMQAAVDSMTDNSALVLDAASYTVSAPIVLRGEKRAIIGKSYGTEIKTAGDHAIFKFDNTVNVYKYAIECIRFTATNPGPNTSGIEISGATRAWFAHNKFAGLFFEGTTYCIRCTKTLTKFFPPYNVLPFGQCIFTELQAGRNDSGVYPQHGIYFDGSPGSHNLFSDSTWQTTITGIAMGNGISGVGDQQIIGNSFNLAADPIKIIGPVSADEYQHHMVSSGNQFDGDAGKAHTITRMRDITLTGNVYGFGVLNQLQNVRSSSIDRGPLESSYGIQKEGLAAGSITDLFDVLQTTYLESGYASAFVEVSVGGLLAGTGQAQTTSGFNIAWAAAVPTIYAVFSYPSGTNGAVILISTAVVGGAVRFTVTINSTLPGSKLNCSIRLCSSQAKIEEI